MIEVASFPKDLSAWDGQDPAFYLEIFGETDPVMDSNYGEVIPPGGSSAATTVSTPIYEYWWTIGHPGLRPEQHHLFGSHDTSLWSNLDDSAAHVYLYFPINSGWRIKELVATVKYLSPVQNQLTLSGKAGEHWQKIAPALSDASAVAQLLGPIPGVGIAAMGAAPILSALSKLQIGTVPQGAKGFEWYVEKVTTAGVSDRGVMQGVMWSIPKTMFEALGGRLTGSLAVSFIPSKQQGDTNWAPRQAALRGHACVYSEGAEHWVPKAKNQFIELMLTPKMPGSFAP